MPFTVGPLTFDSAADAGTNWLYSGPAGSGLNASSNGFWRHSTAGTPSSGVGPDNDSADSGSGYVYTENSGQSDGAVFTMEYDQNFNASSDQITLSFRWCIRGDSAQALIQVQTNEGGAGWVTRATTGFGDETIPGTNGATTWYDKSYQLPVSDASTRIRFRVVCDTDPANTGSFWHNDVGIDFVRIVGESSAVGDPPVITLLGDASIVLAQNEAFTDPGATASDTEDGNLTASIVVGGDTVDTSTFGTYTITYSVTDSDNNTVVASRTVSINPYQFITDPWDSFPSGPSTWTLSGNTITQSGSGTLEGLDAIAGVTLCEVNGKKVYDVQEGDRQLDVTGTLFIDPEAEQLLMGYDGTTELFNVLGTGHLIIGRPIDQEGFRRHSTGTAIDFSNTNTVGSFTDRVSFEGDSRLDWFGGVLALEGGKFGFYGDSVTVRLYSLEAQLLFRTQNEQNQIRQETDDFISEQFTFINGDFTIVGTQQQLNGYTPTHCTGSFGWSGATPKETVTIRNYGGGGRGNILDCKHWSGQLAYLINSASGSQLNAGAHIPGNNGSYGSYRVDQEIQFTLLDLANQPIEGAKLFIRDTDNGQRRTYSEDGFTFNETADRTYTETTDTSGQFPVVAVRIANQFADRQSGANNNAPNTGRFRWDYRGKEDSPSDLFDIHLWSYAHLYQPLPDTVLKSAGVLRQTVKLITDPSIGEQDRTVVAGYDQLETATKAYDAGKLWKLDNLESPSIGELPLGRSGQTITSTFDIALQPTTNAQPFQFDGTTVTIYTGPAFTGSVETTGTVTRNGVDVTGTITDINGTQITVTFTGLPVDAEIRVYDTDPADGILGTDRAGTETTTGTTFSFTHQATDAGQTVTYQILANGYVELTAELALAATNQTIPINLTPEENI